MGKSEKFEKSILFSVQSIAVFMVGLLLIIYFVLSYLKNNNVGVRLAEINNRIYDIDMCKFKDQLKAYYIKGIMDGRGMACVSVNHQDINGDGELELLINSYSRESASGHPHDMLVFEGRRLAFVYEGDDSSFIINPKIPKNQLWIKEPIRVFGEAMCCPSKYDVKIIECKNEEMFGDTSYHLDCVKKELITFEEANKRLGL